MAEQGERRGRANESLDAVLAVETRLAGGGSRERGSRTSRTCFAASVGHISRMAAFSASTATWRRWAREKDGWQTIGRGARLYAAPERVFDYEGA